MNTELEELIQAEMERSRLPGLAIALVKGGELVWSRGYGYADLESHELATPATVFSAQSVTKTIIATALMQWHERGRFGLDDPVNEHLAAVRLENEWEADHPVTIRQLLTHSAGLPVDFEVTSPEAEGAVALEAYLARVAKTVRPPGGDMVYANWGYDVLGCLIGTFAQQRYDEYVRECVLGPLDMGSSAFQAETLDRIATGYYLSALDRKQYALEPIETQVVPRRPSGSLLSTVEDLSHFLIAHLNGGRYGGRQILSEASIAEMHRLHVRWGSSEGGMGLGFRVERASGHHLICHGGDGVTSTAFIGAYPKEQVGVALLINLGRAQTARSVIAQAALRALAGEAIAGPPPKARNGSWERYTGRYVSNFWGIDATLSLDDGRPTLRIEGGIVASEGGERSLLWRDENGVISATGGPFDGFELAFEYGEDGRAERFSGGLYPFTFERQGDAEPEASVDEQADLVGSWSGTVASPMGPLPVTLVVADGGRAAITVLSAQDTPVGDFRVFLRLTAAAGKLGGRVYARGAFGEVPMRVELERR